MEEAVQDPSIGTSTSLRDIEEKTRLMRDRILLLGQSVIEEREKNFKDIQEMKGAIIKLKEDVLRLKELMQRMAEQITQAARKDELMILQRQLDLLRES